MSDPRKIELAIVSIRGSRRHVAAIEKHLDRGGKYRVTLHGELTAVWGSFDGVDQEFQMDVDDFLLDPIA